MSPARAALKYRTLSRRVRRDRAASNKIHTAPHILNFNLW